jgi:hypothetical protein
MNSCLAPLRNQSLDGPTRQHSQQKSELHTGDQEHKNINRVEFPLVTTLDLQI